jgi:uncharacterized PurR-regulated membrane protein YhhQ (DUF165 family)
MFKIEFKGQNRFPDYTLSILYMFYVSFVISSIVLFDTMIKLNIFGINVVLSGSIIPYTFLYPISFIALRLYGYRSVNQMIICMILSTLVFTSMCHFVTELPAAQGIQSQSSLRAILQSSYQMYFAGFIALPAGIYSSFIALSLLDKVKLHFGVLALTISTIVGEFVNTIIVFPLGSHSTYSLSVIVKNIITDALIFKFSMGIVLALITVVIINILTKNYET